MSEVVYTHDLEWREFNVYLPEVEEWVDANIPNCCGFSADTKLHIHFTETPSYEYITALDDYWASLTDDGTYDAETTKAAAIAKEEARISCGLKVKAYLGYMCERDNFNPIQYGEMLADETLSLANMLLLNGALETVKGLLSLYTPTTYFTSEMQAELDAELDKHIAMINNM